MAAPSYVPTPVLRPTAKAYAGPRRLTGPWRAERPGEVIHDGGQPVGERLGSQGPDQGYALRLARQFETRLRLAPGERHEDVVAGCLGVALKRAALYGRAPVATDLEVAFGLFGFLDEPPSGQALTDRRTLFAGVAHHHHYVAARRIADQVPESTLRIDPAA